MGRIVRTKASGLKSEEGEAHWFLDSLVTVKVSGAQASGRLTILDLLNPPGFSPPAHRHLMEDEVHVISGLAIFFCDGETFEEFTAEAGTPAVTHSLAAPGSIDFAAVGQAAARHNIEILGPPPARPARAPT